MDSARPPGSSEIALATRKVQEGSQQGSAGLENGQKRQEGASPKIALMGWCYDGEEGFEEVHRRCHRFGGSAQRGDT